MAQEVRTFTYKVPKGGTALAPQVFPLTMPPRIVKNVELFFPAGNGGQLWIALGFVGTHIIPMNSGEYITAENDTLKWPLDNFPDSGAWQLFAYNTGNYPHLIQLRFLVNIPGKPEVVEQNLTETLSIVSDSGGGGFGGGGGGGGGGSGVFTVPPDLGPVTIAQGSFAQTSLGITEHGVSQPVYVVTVVGLPYGVTANPVQSRNKLIYVIVFSALAGSTLGTANVDVQVSAGGITQTASLELTVTGTVVPTGQATLAFNAVTVNQGGTLTFSGTGWSPGEHGSVYIGASVAAFTADATGAIKGTIMVAADATPGTYTSLARGAVNTVTGPQITVNRQY